MLFRSRSTLSFAVGFSVITVLHIVVGEMAPKTRLDMKNLSKAHRKLVPCTPPLLPEEKLNFTREDNATKFGGTSCEHWVFAYFLLNQINIAEPMVDNGVDCLIEKEDEQEQEEYERSEELKRLDATRWTLQKELEKEIRDANALRDENKNLSYSFDKLQREHDFVTEKLQAADLHVEMLEKTHRAARESLKAAEEEKFQAERAVRNAKTDAEMALKRKESEAISENRAQIGRASCRERV